MYTEKPIQYRFRYNERLHHKKDFQQVIKFGRRLVHPAILVYIYEHKDSSGLVRLGLITNHKVGKAVQRNRFKRRLREIFRLNKHKLKKGVDMIFVLRKEGINYNYHQLESMLKSLWEKAGIWSE